MSNARLTSLVIHKYRHVVPGTSLEFGAGFNVLLGRNGTGKTTLLELIEMVWSKGFRQIADEPFHLEYTVEFDDLPTRPSLGEFPTVPGCRIHAKVENAPAEAPHHDPRNSRTTSPPLQFRYHVTAGTLEDVVLAVIKGTPMGALLLAEGRSSPLPVLAASDHDPVIWVAPAQYYSVEESSDPEPKATSHVAIWAEWCNLILMRLHNTGRYDESLGGFQALTSNEHRLIGSGLNSPHWEIERRLDNETKVYPFDDRLPTFYPQPLLDRWHTDLKKDPRCEPPEFLGSISETSVAVFLELTVYKDVLVKSGTPARERRSTVERLKFGPPEFRIILQNDRGEIPAQALSYGEKRLLAFLWHLACEPSVIIADELVNGFHHEWIERCVELITGRQAFLASQNPLLLDCLPLASEDDVRRSFITCHRDPDGQMIWKNLSVEEAADFYRSYQLQIRHTSEILRGQDLW